MKLQPGLGAYAIRPGNRFYSSGSPHWAEISKRVLQKMFSICASKSFSMQCTSVKTLRVMWDPCLGFGSDFDTWKPPGLDIYNDTYLTAQLQCHMVSSTLPSESMTNPSWGPFLGKTRLKSISWSKDSTYHNKSYPNRTWTFCSTCTDRKLSLIQTHLQQNKQITDKISLFETNIDSQLRLQDLYQDYWPFQLIQGNYVLQFAIRQYSRDRMSKAIFTVIRIISAFIK